MNKSPTTLIVVSTLIALTTVAVALFRMDEPEAQRRTHHAELNRISELEQEKYDGRLTDSEAEELRQLIAREAARKIATLPSRKH